MANIAYFIIHLSVGIHLGLGLCYLLGRWSYLRIIGVLFLFISYIQFQFQLIYSEALFYYPYFFLSYVPPILWFGPLFYLLFQRLLFQYTPSMAFYLRHFFLPVLSIFLLGPIFIKSPDIKLALIHSLYYSEITIEYLFLSVICVGSLMFYIALLFFSLPSIKRMQTKAFITSALFIILCISIVFSGLSFASQLTHSLSLLFIGNAIFSFLLITCYLLHLRFRFFVHELFDEIRLAKDRQSHLTSINIHKVLANLNYVIHEEKIYRDPQLSLSSLANRLQLNTHQLSELLNIEVGKNFHSYITDFRIKDAIQELKRNEHATIMSIALSVGFNSNSAFYTAFKKVTGKSPSDYRER
jgi:AraC-like DNA-binding protein